MLMGNTAPWEGLGADFDRKANVKDNLRKAKLDWKISREPLFTAAGDEVKGFSSLTRSSDGRVMDVVGGRYVPTQNHQAFEFFLEFVEAGKAKMETIGQFGDGQYVWGLANLAQSFEVSKGDKVHAYLLCVCPHKKGKSLVFKTTSIRPWCMNTLAQAVSEKTPAEWRMGHRVAFEGAKVEEARTTLGNAREQFFQFEKDAKKLNKIKMSQDDMVKVLNPIFNKDEAEDSRRMKQLIEAYEKAPGAIPGTAWGVLQGVTYYADHVASRTSDKRLTNAWLGRTAVQKELVLERLLELA